MAAGMKAMMKVWGGARDEEITSRKRAGVVLLRACCLTPTPFDGPGTEKLPVGAMAPVQNPQAPTVQGGARVRRLASGSGSLPRMTPTPLPFAFASPRLFWPPSRPIAPCGYAGPANKLDFSAAGAQKPRAIALFWPQGRYGSSPLLWSSLASMPSSWQLDLPFFLYYPVTWNID